MNPEENKTDGKDTKIDTKEELVDALHNKGKLQSLRTYQGDVANFIHDKDKSVAEIAIENKEKKEALKKSEEKAIEEEKKRQKNGKDGGEVIKKPENKLYDKDEVKEFKEDTEKPKSKSTNFLISVLGIVLLVGSVAVGSYLLYLHYKLAPVELSVPSNALLRFDKVITLDSASFGRDTLSKAISTAKADSNYNKGITNIEILDSNTKQDITALQFVQRLGLQIPPALLRSLDNQFMAGLYGDGEKSQFFMILKENDYGIAFRDMLAWEADMPNDFNPILNFTDISGYLFKDLIVKNKDTRSFSSKFGNVSLIYTFLNQKAILITESPSGVTALVNAFATGNIVR